MAKKLKLKLPKRVAGVKIPRAVRKGPIGEFLNSGAGQIIIAQALVAAVGALAVSRSDPDSKIGRVARHPIDATRRAGRRAAHAGADQAARISYALREAAFTFREAMETGPRELETGPREAGLTADLDEAGLKDDIVSAEPPPTVASEGGGKKKQPSRADPSIPH